MANRIWHYLFGTGIVRTPDDFGRMGEKPSHPELLDYLAACFAGDPGSESKVQSPKSRVPSPESRVRGPRSKVQSPEEHDSGLGTRDSGLGTRDPGPNMGWSIKRLVRSLILTQAFRMSGQAEGRASEADPRNVLLHHFPARRLEAEVIRDSILAVSGRLDRTLYGPSIQPYRDDPKPERRLFGGPLDGNGRRSIYTKITLMGGPKFLEVFNFPDPKSSQGRRDVTNVPAQALTLLNDPFVTGQADFWAQRLVAAPDASAAARIERMFAAALSRAPLPAESERFEKALRELAALHEVPETEILKSRPLWKDLAHAMFNLKEFIYVR
jgi:hypothetical protein